MSADTASSSKKVFYRDSKGELHALKPGEENPDEKREREKTDEDRHYEDYLAGKSAGKVRKIGGYSDGVDRAAFTASDSFDEVREGGPTLLPYGSHVPAGVSNPTKQEERKHAPAKAYNHRNKIKGKPRQAGDGMSDTLADEINAGGAKLKQALERARADSESDGGGDDDSVVSAATLADRAMQVYNIPIPKAQQLDVYGNDLNVPKRERKMRKFLECFAEELQVKTLEGKVVLKDFEDLRKRYGAVFRESGHMLRGTVRKRFLFGSAAAPSFVLDFERHESLVTPRPGLSLDGSMGVLPPRTQDLVVLYQSEANEISAMWIAPDKLNYGGDPQMGRPELEASELFPRFRALVENLTGGASLEVSYQSFM